MIFRQSFSLNMIIAGVRTGSSASIFDAVYPNTAPIQPNPVCLERPYKYADPLTYRCF